MKPWKEVDGWFSEEEGEALQKLSVGKVCLEVGSYKGRSTCAMLEVAKHVHAVDYFRSNLNGQCQEETYTTLEDFKQNTEGGAVTVWIGSSLHACRNFEPESLDLVFIDGLHTYEATRSDILSWWERLKTGGIMCFHDYVTFEGVTRAVDETFLELDGRAHSFVWGTKKVPFLKWEKQ